MTEEASPGGNTTTAGAVEPDEFTRGYLIAVSNLINHMGPSTQTSELLGAINATPEMIAAFDFTEFDIGNLSDGLRYMEPTQ